MGDSIDGGTGGSDNLRDPETLKLVSDILSTETVGLSARDRIRGVITVLGLKED